MPIFLQPATPADIPALTTLSVSGFKNDRHTIVKTLGNKPYDHEAGTIEGYHANFASTKFLPLKATDEEGDLIGSVSVWCIGVERSAVCGQEWTAVLDQNVQDIASVPALELKVNESHAKLLDDSVEELKQIEAESIQKMQKVLTPSGAQCLIFNGISVTPGCQRRGVGTTMLSWACEQADRLRLYIWIHASEEIWPLCTKFGFYVVEELVIDLDKYAPRRPTKDEISRMARVVDGKWGVYTIRYMKRDAQKD